MFYVYILRSKKDNKFYTGSTNNLGRRINEHNSGLVFSTKSRIPFELVYYEAYRSKQDAMNREKQLKRFSKSYGMLKRRIHNSLMLQG